MHAAFSAYLLNPRGWPDLEDVQGCSAMFFKMWMGLAMALNITYIVIWWTGYTFVVKDNVLTCEREGPVEDLDEVTEETKLLAKEKDTLEWYGTV